MTTISPTSASRRPASASTPRPELLDSLDVAAIEAIPPSGGNRQYWRVSLADGRELIACHGADVRENRAFFSFARQLRRAGINCPKVVRAVDGDTDYLQTSVGRRSLYDCLERTDLIGETIDMLAHIHGIKGVDFSSAYPVGEMNRRAIFWDLNYFKYYFLKPLPGLELDEALLEDDFEKLAQMALEAQPRGLMLRDFQSRNVMIDSDGRPAVIDFQGARLGPVAYDLVSFLWQGRAGFTPQLRRDMIDRYCRTSGIPRDGMERQLPAIIALRMMQVLGAYGFRGNVQGRTQFLGQVPAALASLREALTRLPLNYLNKMI